MRKKGENSVKRAGKADVPPDGMMFSSLGSKVNPSHLADSAALRGCSAVVEAAPVARLKAGIASRNSVKVSTFDQRSALAPTLSFLPTNELSAALARIIQY